MDKYQIFSAVAPVAAPAAPAAMLISILYADMIAEGVAHEVALATSIGSGIGAEMSGMIAAYVGVQAFQRRKYGLMLVAAVAFIAYAVFMAVGISVTNNPLTMISTILISIIAYFAVGLLKSLQEAQAEEHEAKAQQIELAKQQANIARAQAKIAKAGGVQSPVQLSSVQTVQPVHGNLNPDRLQITRELLARNPNATTRDVAAAIGAGSPSTGKAYRDAVLSENQ